MAKTLAVFGAGSGLSQSAARRFGRDGYRVALVARRRELLESRAEELRREGLEVATHRADLADLASLPGLVGRIQEQSGPIDVLYYGPLTADQQFTPAANLDAPTQQALLDLFFLAPMMLVGEVLPGMLERGDGGILVTEGSTAVNAIPGMSGLGPAMAATRNWIYSLHGEVADKGVYAGILIIGAGIDRSEMTALRRSSNPDAPASPAVDPDFLAEMLWDLYTKRDRPGLQYPAPSQQQ